LRYGFISSTNNEGLFSLDRQRKLVSPHLNRHLNAFVHFLPNPNPADPNRFMLEMGAGTDNTNPTFQINFKLAPAGFLSFAHPERVKITFDQDEMIFEGDDIGLRVNCASGRLEDFHFLLTKTTNQFASASLNRLIGKVTFEKGAYERLAREIGEASVNYTNAYDSQTPVSSLVAFVVEELVQVPPVAGLVFGTVPPERLKQASICLETLFIKNRQILAPFERLIEQYQTPEGEESFLIPRDADSQSSGDSMTALWAGILIRLSADALPAGSWPSLLAREAGLAAAGKGQHTAQVLSAIYQSPQSGPLAFWATASLLKRFNIEAFRSFANGGLTRLTAADFRNDYRMLLEGDSALTQCLANLADTLRDLGDTEREGLAIILPPPECELLRRCIRDLRSDKGQPLVSVLAPALDAYWDQTLKGRIRSALLGLALNSKATGTSSSAEAKQPADATPPNALASSLPKDPEAQFQLERRLTQERGAAKNPGEAAKWYRRAAEQGHVLAQVGLGYAYAQGDGVPKDDTEAVKWFLLAAGKGNTDAQFNVATLYYQGQGTPQNYAEAEKWFRCVAEKGDPEAQSIVGVFYVQGWGVATNYAKAEHWLRQSAEQGNPKGQCNLGVLYRLGTGVPQDEVEALVWFTLAANQGHDKARQYRDEIRSKLTAEQIAEAERRAKAFAPRKANR
jgi:hypothetical protein